MLPTRVLRPNGLVVNDPEVAFQYIPHLEVGYETYDKEHRRPYGYLLPQYRV